ncbi:MAG: DUF2309 domain-containing protein [Chromatiaceae bacterium]|nr:DUF2309 domain-containing protein [Chromatiaceae bacterium]MCP5307104.1 DUF2309 domain-containing protein [Chromatiaceae bacterium]MCP5423266.1 DUF2309 domain-containing protein [Chromatiaceae bacterium]
MSPPIGQKLRVRAMIYVAGEPVPFFWPMRAFIHHNPLHGLEQLPFDKAVAKGERLFHARGFLPRTVYQRYLADGQVDRAALEAGIRRFVAIHSPQLPFDLGDWLVTEMTRRDCSVVEYDGVAEGDAVHAALHGEVWQAGRMDADDLTHRLQHEIVLGRPIYEVIDSLYGTDIGTELDERVIRACLDFFDEGQSIWTMPERERGFFGAWLDVAGQDVRRTLDTLLRNAANGVDHSPENVIALVLESLDVPEDGWVSYFTQELARLHGWAGFIRWRSNASNYYWEQRYPGDLVDYMAVRMLLALTLLRKRAKGRMPITLGALSEAVNADPFEFYLRQEFRSRHVFSEMAHTLEDALLRGDRTHIAKVFVDYHERKQRHAAQRQAERLRSLAAAMQQSEALKALSVAELNTLLDGLRTFRAEEGMIWLRAMEAKAMGSLLHGLNFEHAPPRDKRPFAKAAFCIDTRSERLRRSLESIGDYETYGIAGFFGVPVSFMELGKGSENHLCPVLLTPKNLVIEMTTTGAQDAAALSALEKAMHELKESVLTPFVTVEAIGLLFGFDMFGKTLLPTSYNRWRERLHEEKPPTHLVQDKLSREQADSIVRAVQRAVIVKAVEQDFGLEPERITDDIVRELREAALGHQSGCPAFAAAAGIDGAQVERFIGRLRGAYRINQAFAQLQLERLGRIGFSLDEQTRFVTQALQSIGLTDNFSRFILLVGHGSRSENNPYESALDCGACGGSHGLVSARVLAQMANKPEVRRRLRSKGIDIPDDAWFVPALHNTTTDEVQLHDLALLPPSHLIYLDRLRNGLGAASRLCAQERLPSLEPHARITDAATAIRNARRNSMDWSQVRPEWGLSRNAYFIIGRRALTQATVLDGRAFLHSYDYRVDRKRRLLENILTGPLVVGQWINMEHYFSTVDNERFGSGSKVYHNVAGRFGVMTGNLSDLRTGLPAQTVLDGGRPYHQPMRLITVIEAPFEHAIKAVEGVVAVKRLVRNGWIRLLIVDPEASTVCLYDDGEWRRRTLVPDDGESIFQELCST